jgi:cytoskeleton protein RodZ
MISEVQEDSGNGQSPAAITVAAGPAGPTVGQQLLAERQRQGLSIPEVAQRLKYAPRQIEAVESDNFKALPGLTFVRGFVRGYARLLGIDGDILVRALERSAELDSGPTTVQLQGVSGTRAQFPSGGTSHKAAWPWLLAILLAVAGIGGYSVYNWQAPNDLLPQASVRQAPVTPQTQVVLEGAAVPQSQPAGAPSQLVVPDTDPASQDTVVTGTTNAAAAKAADLGPGHSQGRVKLVFAGESWTEIRDAGGKVLLSRKNAAGSEQSADGTPPFDLVVGNAREVKLYYNGAEVDMTPYTKVSVAKFQLK